MYGKVLWERDATPAAEDLLRRALELDPGDIRALCVYARVLKGMGKRELGVDRLHEARELSLGGPLEMFVAQEVQLF